MRGRRSVRGELPHAPLLMVHPLQLPGGEIPGHAIVSEVSTGEALALFSVHGHVLRWSHEPDRFSRETEGWSGIERVMLWLPDTDLGQPLAVLAGYFTSTAALNRQRIAQACLCVSDWAMAHGFRGTAADFARAAALAWPQNPRYACIAGGILRAGGQVSEAEWWFRRGHRLAVWTKDREAEVRALLGQADARRARNALADSILDLYRRAIMLATRYEFEELKMEAVAALESGGTRDAPPGRTAR